MNAGLLPKLRDKYFLPLPVLLNGKDVPAETVVAAFCAACRQPGLRMTEGDHSGPHAQRGAVPRPGWP